MGGYAEMRYLLMTIYILFCVFLLSGYGLWVFNQVKPLELAAQLLIIAFNLAAVFVVVFIMWIGFANFFDEL